MPKTCHHIFWLSAWRLQYMSQTDYHKQVDLINWPGSHLKRPWPNPQKSGSGSVFFVSNPSQALVKGTRLWLGSRLGRSFEHLTWPANPHFSKEIKFFLNQSKILLVSFIQNLFAFYFLISSWTFSHLPLQISLAHNLLMLSLWCLE